MKVGGSKTVTRDARVLGGCVPIRDVWHLKIFPHHDVGDGDEQPEHPEDLRERCYEKPVCDRDRAKRGHARSQDECG